MLFFDLELIDVNENVQNFSFEKLTKNSLDIVLQNFKEKSDFIEFECAQGNVVLERKFIRGIMYVPHVIKQKSVLEETMENAEVIGDVSVVKNKKKSPVKG